jgi:hypothetical protein
MSTTKIVIAYSLRALRVLRGSCRPHSGLWQDHRRKMLPDAPPRGRILGDIGCADEREPE